MVVTRSVDYAVEGILHLARLPRGTVASVEEIARERGLPSHALGTVVRRLARAGLVATQRGTGGGVSLLRDPSEITMRHVVEAIDGPLRLADSSRSAAPARAMWKRIEAAILKELEGTTLADLARQPTGGASVPYTHA
ncbi:MAG: Rrf2 family transcriptional regulator [Nitrospirae bacterium]|nr:MAG: Rrf2 family transcriptional regulator [Nitrospirota bacterium]